MCNKAYAQEWLLFTYKNLDTAYKLFELDHYMDIIGMELQQGVEKTLKSLFAYHGLKIRKMHNLEELVAELETYITFNEDELDLIDKITQYYKVERYPNPNYFLPPKSEMQEALLFGETF